VRYRVEVEGDKLVMTVCPEGHFPLRAQGFLQFSPKEHSLSELMMEVRNGEILVWIAPQKPFTPSKRTKGIE